MIKKPKRKEKGSVFNNTCLVVSGGKDWICGCISIPGEKGIPKLNRTGKKLAWKKKAQWQDDDKTDWRIVRTYKGGSSMRVPVRLGRLKKGYKASKKRARLCGMYSEPPRHQKEKHQGVCNGPAELKENLFDRPGMG